MPSPQAHHVPHIPPGLAPKLAACGETLTAQEWAALPQVARRRLEQVPATTPMERAALRLLLRWLRETFPPQRSGLTERSGKH